MKTGKPTRLSEKLNADIDAIRQEHADLMASHLESFRTDMISIAQSAQTTIETGTQRLVEQNRNWLKELTSQAKDCVTISPWMILWIAVAGITMMMLASLFWTAFMTRSEIEEMGLTRITRDAHTWLIMDPDRTELQICTLARAPVMCVKIRKR
ncbi:hypothetical protein KUV57_01850 [Epibacterium sp. DP7N7-1]|nr:hypothetical protein [Epibacterium sp. DP7N7-1]